MDEIMSVLILALVIAVVLPGIALMVSWRNHRALVRKLNEFDERRNVYYRALTSDDIAELSLNAQMKGDDL
jgi:hypothetical protein